MKLEQFLFLLLDITNGVLYKINLCRRDVFIHLLSVLKAER